MFNQSTAATQRRVNDILQELQSDMIVRKKHSSSCNGDSFCETGPDRVRGPAGSMTVALVASQGV